jgi:hypothetical protein
MLILPVLVLKTEIFIRPGGNAGRIIDGINPGAGRAVAEPLKKNIQFFPGTLGPDFDIPDRGIADPA